MCAADATDPSAIEAKEPSFTDRDSSGNLGIHSVWICRCCVNVTLKVWLGGYCKVPQFSRVPTILRSKV